MKWRKLLPTESFYLTSKLTVDKIKMRLANEMIEPSTIRFSIFPKYPTKPYKGRQVNDAFEISRIISYRNSFLPLVKGNVESYLGKTIIKVRMRMFKSVIIGMSIWFGLTGLICIFSFILLINFERTIKEGLSSFIFGPILMFLFGWGLMIICFKWESKKATEFLIRIFEAEKATDY